MVVVHVPCVCTNSVALSTCAVWFEYVSSRCVWSVKEIAINYAHVKLFIFSFLQKEFRSSSGRKQNRQNEMREEKKSAEILSRIACGWAYMHILINRLNHTQTHTQYFTVRNLTRIVYFDFFFARFRMPPNDANASALFTWCLQPLLWFFSFLFLLNRSTGSDSEWHEQSKSVTVFSPMQNQPNIINYLSRHCLCDHMFRCTYNVHTHTYARQPMLVGLLLMRYGLSLSLGLPLTLFFSTFFSHGHDHNLSSPFFSLFSSSKLYFFPCAWCIRVELGSFEAFRLIFLLHRALPTTKQKLTRKRKKKIRGDLYDCG